MGRKNCGRCAAETAHLHPSRVRTPHMLAPTLCIKKRLDLARRAMRGRIINNQLLVVLTLGGGGATASPSSHGEVLSGRAYLPLSRVVATHLSTYGAADATAQRLRWRAWSCKQDIQPHKNGDNRALKLDNRALKLQAGKNADTNDQPQTSVALDESHFFHITRSRAGHLKTFRMDMQLRTIGGDQNHRVNGASSTTTQQ